MRQRPAFFWCALVAGAVCLALWGVTLETLVRGAGVGRNYGYLMHWRDGALYIAGIVPGGPADGKLNVGDRVVSVNGDRRASKVGVAGTIDLPFGGTYRIRVARSGVEREIELAVQPYRFEPPRWGLGSCLLSGFTGIAMAMLLGMAKPRDRTVQLASSFLLLNGLVALGVAIDYATLRGFRRALLGVFGILGNLSQPIGYECAAAFPVAVDESRAWKTLRVLIWTLCLAAWLLLLPGFAACLLPADSLVAFYARFQDPVNRINLLWAQWFPVRGIVLTVAASAVLLRNYVRLPDRDQRRRIRIVVGAAILILVPQLVMQGGIGLFKLTGHGFNPQGAVRGVEIAITHLTGTVLAVALAYAILRHRALGIEIVIRQGLRYLLAKRVLEGLLLLPLIVLAARIAANPGLTVADALFGNWLWMALMVAAALGLRFRRQALTALDRRFFREAYDRERILTELIDQLRQRDTAQGLARLVCGRIEAALHPERTLLVYRREGTGELAVESSSGEAPEIEVPADFDILASASDSGPTAEWLARAGIELVVPIVGTDGAGLGALLVGFKKSEEPYSAADRSLLDAIATQLGIVYENLRLKESVDRERQIKRQVLARVEEAGINLVKECPSCGACYDRPATRCEKDGRELALTLPVERVIEGRYRLDRRIGEGGMGAVYQAWDERLSRSIAVKVMVGSLFGNQTALRRFEREAQAAARLHHPNIVAVHDFGVLGGDGAYLVMELIEGHSLRTELDRDGALAPQRAAECFDQILAGLGAAHAAGVIHRDLKPGNILIADADGVKIADFGLAKLKTIEAEEHSTLTMTGTVLGTMGYMSPEQLLGKEADERSDLFTVGVVLHEALTGRRPFVGRTPPELLAAQVRGAGTSLGDGPEIARLNAVLASCLARDPAERPASAEELRNALVDALRDCPSIPGATPGVDRAAKTETAGPDS